MVGEYIAVGRAEDIVEGEVRPYNANGTNLVLAKYHGEIYALANLCSHDGGDLGEADLVGDCLRCPRHGARFDLKTGAAKSMPAVVGIDTYDVKIENGIVMVAIPRE